MSDPIEPKFAIILKNHEIDTRAFYAYSREEADAKQAELQATGEHWDVYTEAGWSTRR